MKTMFRLVVYHTHEANKYAAEERFEYFGSADAIWRLWYTYARELKLPHVEVYSLDGAKQFPEKGINGLTGYNI